MQDGQTYQKACQHVGYHSMTKKWQENENKGPDIVTREQKKVKHTYQPMPDNVVFFYSPAYPLTIYVANQPSSLWRHERGGPP